MTRTIDDTKHYCDGRLLPGECIRCLDTERPFVSVHSWAGTEHVEVEILARTPRRWKVRFLQDSINGSRGSVRYIAHDAVSFPAAAQGQGEVGAPP